MALPAFVKNHRVLSIVIGVALVFLLAVGAIMVTDTIAPVSWGWYGDYASDEGIAINGYDVVQYHADNRAAKGDPAITAEYAGFSWHFASAENRSRFVEAPEQYVPEYGGYCAFAVSKGFTASSTPAVFHVADGRLYLFSNQEVKETYVSEIGSGAISSADAHWADREPSSGPAGSGE